MSEAALLSAVKSGDAQTVRRMIDDGADVNARIGSSCKSPIFYAKSPDIMRMLIANGAQVNLRDNQGWTPLHTRGRGGSAACCELLLSNNADIEAESNFGSTPLHIAAYNSQSEVAYLLLTHQRSRHGREGVGSLLVKTTNSATGSGGNALHCAVYSKSTSSRTARVLLEQCRGKDGYLLPACYQLMSTKAPAGKTPLDVARTIGGKSEVVDYLEAFTNLALADSASQEDCGLAVMLNPKLDDFQRAIATDCLALMVGTFDEVPDAALYIMLGYLSCSDAMKR